MAQKRILVTGGLGLIGHNVVSKLEKLGHHVVVLDSQTNYNAIPTDELNYLLSERQQKIRCEVHKNSILQPSVVNWLLQKHQIDTIVHLASYPRQQIVSMDPAAASGTMSEGLLLTLDAAVANEVSRFVYISSSMVYGDFADQVKETAECRPQGQYGILKLAGEWLVKDYTRKHKLEHVIIRPSAVYGPLDVADRVVGKFLTTAIQGKTIKVHGVNEALDFTYVSDAADGIVAAALREQAANKTYNITRGVGRSLLEAATLAIKIVKNGTFEICVRNLNFPVRGALNIDAARKDLDFNPTVDIAQGFEMYYNWFINSDYWKSRLT